MKRWALTGWTTAFVVAMVTALLAVPGVEHRSLQVALRATAATSVILFSVAFSASSLFDLSRNPITTWLLKNRRYVGVGFAVSHFIHLGLIAWVAVGYPNPFFANRGATEFIGGGIAYVFIAAMAATSFDRTTRWLGPKRWKALHTAGGYYILLIFLQRYVRDALVDPVVIPLAALTVCVLLLRVWRRFSRRSES